MRGLLPSFLGTSKMGKLQGDFDRLIMFALKRSLRCLSRIGRCEKGNRYGRDLIGGESPVSSLLNLFFPIPNLFSRKYCHETLRRSQTFPLFERTNDLNWVVFLNLQGCSRRLQCLRGRDRCFSYFALCFESR